MAASTSIVPPSWAGKRLRRVLVVEDDPFLRRSLARALSGWGLGVVQAETAAEGCEQLYDERGFELVLCDVRLPDGHGEEVLRLAGTIRPAPIVIAMSGAASAEEGWRLGRAGAHAFLPKPVSLDDLRTTVDRVLGRPTPLDVFALANVGVRTLRDVQTEVRSAMLEQAIAMSSGNYTEAAKLLAVTRQAVRQSVQLKRESSQPPPDHEDEG